MRQRRPQQLQGPARSRPALLPRSSNRCGSEMLLRLRCRSAAAAALIGPLAWELPYATGVAPKKKKKDCFIKCLTFSICWGFHFYRRAQRYYVFPLSGTRTLTQGCTIVSSFFFFFSLFKALCIHSMWKFPGRGSNPSHSSDLSHSNDNGRSLTTRPRGNSALLLLICISLVSGLPSLSSSATV